MIIGSHYHQYFICKSYQLQVSYIIGIENKLRMCNNSYLTKIEIFDLFNHFIQYRLSSSFVLVHKLTFIVNHTLEVEW